MKRRMTVAQRKKRIQERTWKILDLAHLAVANLFIYSILTGAEYLLTEFGFFLLGGDIQTSPFVASVVSIVRPGLVILTLIAMIIHAGFSFYGAIKLEQMFQKDEVE